MTTASLILLLALLAFSHSEEGAGEKRLRKLRERQELSKGIMSFTNEDFKYVHVK
jgi:hypothetical protein